MISISNLSKAYASGVEALKRINLEIGQGDIFALLGTSKIDVREQLILTIREFCSLTQF